MGKFDGVSDEELIARLRAGETAIEDYLMEKYKGLVRQKARAMFLIGGDTDDLIQEGMIGLFKAVRDFQTDKEASFVTFARVCIDRQIYSAIQNSNRQKHQPGLGISFSHRNDSHGSGTVDRYVDSAGIFPEDQWKAGYGWKCHLYVENTENACRIFFTAHGRGYSGTQEYQCFCCRRASEYVCAAGFEFADDDFLSGGYDKVQSCSYADGCNLCISESASF